MIKFKITKKQYNFLLEQGLVTKPDKKVSKDKVSGEIEGLLKHLYGYTPEFSSDYWVGEKEKSLNEIINLLINNKLLVKKGRNYIVPKSFGPKEDAKNAIETCLREFINEPQEEIEEDYPLGAEHDSTAPYNQPDPEPIINHTDYQVFVYNDGLAILKHIHSNKFFLLDFSDNQVDYEGREMTEDDINDFLNSNETKLENILIPLDVRLIDELGEMYNLNPYFLNKLEDIKKLIINLQENNNDFPNHYSELQPKKRTNLDNKNIVDKLRGIRHSELSTREPMVTKHPLEKHPEDIEEMTSAGGSSGAFTGPLSKTPIHREIKTVNETLSVGGAGHFQYDTPGLVNIGRNGEYKKTTKKTKAEVTPQWAGGSFVEQPECSKLDNNKESQNGGCNSGASSLKTKNSKGSINAPSLGENKIFEEISKQTGKTIDEIKEIILNKNNCK